MYWLDFTGACLSLTSTYYFTQAKRLAWLVGILAIIINFVLYWQKGIYGRVLLEILYFISMIYGLQQWTTQNQQQRPIRSLRLTEAFFYSILAAIGIFLLATYLITFTDSNVPYWDAVSTVLSLLAQWLLCLKVIHCWFLWFIVDAMVAALQYYKGIPFHSALHWLYLGMAVLGYWRWREMYRAEQCSALSSLKLTY